MVPAVLVSFVLWWLRCSTVYACALSSLISSWGGVTAPVLLRKHKRHRGLVVPMLSGHLSSQLVRELGN